MTLRSLRPLVPAFVSLLLAPCSLLLPARAQPAPVVPTELRAVQLEMTSTDTETTAIATENVILTGTNLRITCDQLTVIAHRLDTEEKKTDTIPTVERFKYILAIGNVRIVQGDRESSSARAEVFPQEGKVVLSGSPVVTDHSTGVVASGEPIILLRGQRALSGKNIKITAPPIQDLGANANANTAAKPATPQPAAPGVTFPKPATR
jgi:lipopolysaccharide export system protein LptA